MPIHLGPLNMSINKAVVYLLVGAALSIADRDRHDALAPRRQSPGRRQTVGEVIYDIAQTQVAETGLPHEGDGALVPVRARR